MKKITGGLWKEELYKHNLQKMLDKSLIDRLKCKHKKQLVSLIVGGKFETKR